MEILFLPVNKKWTGAPGKSLLEIAAEADVAVTADCAGDGSCGKCRVLIEPGAEAQPALTTLEEERLTDAEKKKGFRLACCVLPISDLIVQVPHTDLALDRKTDLHGEIHSASCDTGIRQMAVHISSATLARAQSAEERILQALEVGPCTILPEPLRSIAQERDYAGACTVTLRDREVIHIEKREKTGSCCGVAFDIGTTTVVGTLWNLATMKKLDAFAESNAQAPCGADVISRINYAAESRRNLDGIHDKVIGTMNKILDILCKKNRVARDHIYSVTIVGNTTMCHLCLKTDPISLARAPFSPVFTRAKKGNAYQLGLLVNREAEYYMLPCIAGHVGADITAGLLAADIVGKAENVLFLDIGTNGEIVLTDGARTLACSTAAGPAFEGASIYQGMRAASGAVESVCISKHQVEIRTIYDARPAGICGSGIIDAASELRRNGIINKTGKMTTADALQEAGFSEAVTRRIRTGEAGKEFVLAFGNHNEPVVITQKDIREVQLAKAAIQAGISIMMNQLQITWDQLDQICLAGAFGNHISIESAVGIGLIPDIDRRKILSIGNAAGAGASMALLSEQNRRTAESLAQKICHVELSSCDGFQEKYLECMAF